MYLWDHLLRLLLRFNLLQLSSQIGQGLLHMVPPGPLVGGLACQPYAVSDIGMAMTKA